MMRVVTLYWCLVGLGVACVLAAGLLFATGRYWGFPIDYADGEDVDYFMLCLPPLSAVIGSSAYALSSRSHKKRRRLISIRLAVVLALPIAAFLVAFGGLVLMFHFSNQPGSTTYFTAGDFKGWVTICVAGLICASTYVLAYLEGRS